jgi:hypothetical protein
MSETPEDALTDRTITALKARKLISEKPHDGLAQHAHDIVEQITLRKLVHAREFLAASKLTRGGTRDQIRERLSKLVEDNEAVVSRLKFLLDELDAWGDQRIRIGRMPMDELADLKDEQAIIRKVTQAGLEHLLDGQIAVEPPGELTPMFISYEENESGRFLRMVAAKTRQVMVAQKDIPDMRDEEHYPGIVFKPYKEETQKAIDFAEIELGTGLTLSSTTLLRQGVGYRAEFNEFIAAFAPVIALHRVNPVELYTAVRSIRNALKNTEVRIMSRRARTSSGGYIDYRSHSSRADLRADTELGAAEAALPTAPGVHCNCYWEQCPYLDEVVHTFIYAPQGEVSIMGQVREASARYVLHRILQVN